MAEMPVAPVVLDYAPLAERPAYVRWAISIVWLLGIALLGAFVAYFSHPKSYVAVGYIGIEPSSKPIEDVIAIDQAKGAHVAMLVSEHACALISKALAGTPDALTPAEIKTALSARPVSQSRLIAISFEHFNPRTSAAAASAAMEVHADSFLSNVRIINTPALPTQQRFQKLYLLGGAISALLIYGLFVAIRHKCRAAKAAL